MGKRGFLTDKEVRALRPTKGLNRAEEIPAGVVPGLYLVIQPTGTKTFALRYRFRGRTRRLTLVHPVKHVREYPHFSLGDARGEAAAKLEILRDGVDPAAKPKEDQEEDEKTSLDTFESILKEFIEEQCRPNNRSWREQKRILEHDALPAWRKKPIGEITRADVHRLLRSVMKRGAPVMANRLHTTLRSFFNWCIGTLGVLDTSPMTKVKPPAVERTRDHVLSDCELVELWNAAGELGYPFEPYFKLLMLTAQRRGEVAMMRWDDVDLEGSVWTIPREMTKADREHFVPLSEPALRIFEELPRFEGPYVLTTTGGKKPINGFSKAKRRLDQTVLVARRKALKEAGADPDEAEEMADWRVHDIRRTATTNLARLGIAKEVVSKILNHSPGRILGITAVYNRFEYTEERRRALEQWGDHLLELIEEHKAAEEQQTTDEHLIEGRKLYKCQSFDFPTA